MVCDTRNPDLDAQYQAEITRLRSELKRDEQILTLYNLDNKIYQIEFEIIDAYNAQKIVVTEGMPRLINEERDLSTLQRVYDDLDADLDSDEQARIIIQRIQTELESKSGNERILDMIHHYHSILDEKTEYERTLPEGFSANIYDDSDEEQM